MQPTEEKPKPSAPARRHEHRQERLKSRMEIRCSLNEYFMEIEEQRIWDRALLAYHYREVL